MTKRTLYIIIGLLLLLDIAAILIYLAGNTNRDGKSAIDFTRDESTPVVVADTIPDRLSEDRFDTIARNGNFVSEQMVLDDDKEKRMTCTVQFKVVWPQSINGKNKLKDLEEIIIKTMLGKNYNSINEAITSTIENPEFTKPSRKFISVDKSMFGDTGAHHSMQLYRAFPYFRTNFLLEYVILVEKYDGHNMHRSMSVVHYDRLHHQVIDMNDIFNFTHKDEILALVNQSIEKLKADKKNDLIHETTFIPSEFLLGTKSVIFYLPDGRIAPAGTGLYEVHVKNERLMPYFTSFYSELLNNDSHFDSYGFLEW